MDEELTLLDSKKKSEDPFEGRSMNEVLKDKREQTEKILENTKVNQQESMEEEEKKETKK